MLSMLMASAVMVLEIPHLENTGIDRGAGGWYALAECGQNSLYSFRHHPISTFASSSVAKISRFSSSSLNLPLKDSMYPFSQGFPGSMKRASTGVRLSS